MASNVYEAISILIYVITLARAALETMSSTNHAYLRGRGFLHLGGWSILLDRGGKE